MGSNKINYAELEKKFEKLEAENLILNQKVKLLQGIFDKLPFGIQVFDENGTSFSMNTAQQKLLGLESALTGVGSFNVLSDEFSVAHGTSKIYEKVYKGQEYSHEFEYKLGETAGKWGTRHDSVFLHETIFPLTGANNKVEYVVAVLSNISEQKKNERKRAESEQKARENEAQFKNLLDNAPEPIFIQSKEKFAYLNKAAARLYGAESPDDLLGSEVLSRIHPDFKNIVKQRIQQFNEKHRVSDRAEHKHIKLDNTPVDVEVSAMPVNYNNQPGALVFVKDISERIKADQKIKHSHDLLDYVIKHSLNAIAVFDNNLRYINVSKRYLQEYKIKEEDIIGKYHYDVFTDLPEKWKEAHRRALAGEILGADEEPYFRDDGSVEWTRWECRPWYEQSGNIGGIVLYADVITDRKLIEEEIKERNEELTLFFDCALDLLCLANTDGYFIRVNKEWENVLGYTAQELEGRKFLDFVHPDDIEATLNAVRLLAGQKNILNFTNRYRCKNGNYRWIEWKSAPRGNRIYAAARDITDWLENEKELNHTIEKLRETESRLQFSLSASHTGAWDFDLNSYTAVRTLEHDQVFGYNELLPEWNYELFMEHVLEIDRPMVETKFREAVESTGNIDIRFRIMRADGETRWVWACGRHYIDEKGTNRRLAGIIQDITDKQLIEMKLEESYELLKNLTAQVPGVVYQYRLYPDGRSAFPYASPGMWNIYEVTPDDVRDDASPVFNRLHPDDLDYIVRTINDSAKNQTNYESEFRVILPGQGLRWRFCNAKPQLMPDGSTLWHGIITDITRRKLAEEKLKEQKLLFETMFNAISDGVVIADKNRVIQHANQGILKTFGYKPEEVIGKSTQMLYAGNEHYKNSGESVFNVNSKASDNFYLTYYSHKNGQNFPGETFGAKLFDSNGQWIGNLGIMRDISERVKYIEELKLHNDELLSAEEEIRATNEELCDANEKIKISEEKYRALYENAPLAYQSLNEHGNILDVNPMWFKILGYSRNEVVGEWFGSFLHPGFVEHFKKNFPKFKEQGYIHDVQFKMVRKDKTEIFVSFEGCIGYTQYGEFRQTYCTFKDITEELKAKEELLKSEAALRKSSYFFEQLYLQSATSTQLLDAEGWCVRINPKLSELFGVQPKDIEGHKYNILHDGEIIRSGVINKLKRVFENKETVNWEVNFDIAYASETTGIKVSKPLKRWFFNKAYPILNEDGKLDSVIIQHEDISERKNGELALIESEKQLQLIFDNSPALMFLLDAHGDIIKANNTSCEFSGGSEKIEGNLRFGNALMCINSLNDERGCGFSDLCNSCTLRSTVLDCIKGKKEVNKQKIEVHSVAGGMPRKLTFLLSMTISATGAAETFLLTLEDITEQKLMEQKILGTIIQTEEQERKRISRELHDGIGPLLSTVKLYAQTYFNTTNRRLKKTISEQFVSTINDAINHVSLISNNLSPQVLTDFGLKAAIQRYLDKLRPVAKIDIVFEYNIGVGLPEEFNVTLYRVTTELVNNTVKHAGAATMAIRLFTEETKVWLVFSNNGKTFDFEAMKMVKKGMGLFNIVSRIGLLGGTVQFVPGVEKGIEYQISLPL
ncbi:MAG: PAS domain S-box protein [Bacteroidales bacterium]|nr:PAS domain S-box protein [Bacteroidales bacterium]